MNNNFYKKKTILITGANGFKGCWLSLWLTQLGAKVYGIGLQKDYGFFARKINLKKIINFSHLDIREFQLIHKLIKKIKPQLVFHLAGQPLVFEAYRDPIKTFETNSNGTLNILEACNRVNSVKTLVCITSDKSYKNINTKRPYKETDTIMGDDPYSASKSSAEIIINSYQKTLKRDKLGIVVARAGNVIGGGDLSENRIIPDLVRSILIKKKIILRNPQATRPWQYVLDPLHGYLILAMKSYVNHKKFTGAYNFGPENSQTKNVLAVCKSFLRSWKSTISISLSKKQKIKEHGKLVLSIKKSKEILKWKPVYSVNTPISKTCEWYSKVYKDKRDVLKITKNQLYHFAKWTKFKFDL